MNEWLIFLSVMYGVICFFWAILATRIAYKRGDYWHTDGDTTRFFMFLVHFIFCPICMISVIIKDNLKG